MDNIAGSPVEGKDFYGRKADLDRLREMLNKHDILLLGPRRIGKTSIARAVMAHVRTDGWRAVEINVASCEDERGFLDKLDAALRPEIASLAEKARAIIGDGIKAITGRLKSVKLSTPYGELNLGLGANEGETWTQVAGDLLRLIARLEQPWLIYVDELPILLFNIIRNDPAHGVRRVRRFLDWFRNDVRAMPEVHSVRWLVSGSVGLDTLVQQHGMADTINSLKHEGLEAYTDTVAVAMLGELAATYGIDLTEEHRQQLVNSVGWAQPYYLQVAFHHLRSLRATLPGEDVGQLIARAVEKSAQPGEDNDFHHWEGRLFIQLTDAEAHHCVALLSVTAQDPTGTRPESLLAILHERLPDATAEEAKRAFVNLRDILLRDAYWCADESQGHKRYRFRLAPLRLWWLRRSTL